MNTMGDPEPRVMLLSCTSRPYRSDAAPLGSSGDRVPLRGQPEVLVATCRTTPHPHVGWCRSFPILAVMETDRQMIADDELEGVMSTVWDRVRGRAWSRAGAVAAVVSSRPARRVGAMSVRLALLVAGSFLISVSVAVTLWTDLGPGPLDVFIGAIRNITGVSLSLAVWVTVGSIIAIARLLGRRPGIGTFLSPFLIGPMLQGSAAMLDMFEVPESIVVRLLLQVVAIGGIGIGSGALVVSGLGAGSGELFAGAASDRVRRSEPTTRFWIEMAWIVTGVALGGPAGFGTVMVAMLIGPAVFHGHRLVDAGAARFLPRRAVDDAACSDHVLTSVSG